VATDPPDPRRVCIYGETIRMSYVVCVAWVAWGADVVGGGCSISGVDGFRRGVLQLVTGGVLSWVADR
jgi:hypothetical protein